MSWNTITKLSKVVKQGYTPSRLYESYRECSPILKEPYGHFVNCVGHAFFNLKNSQLKELKFCPEDAESLSNFSQYEKQEADVVMQNILCFVKQTGLIVRELSNWQILKSNEWVVAFYVEKDGKDLHFLLKENYHWTGKIGLRSDVECYAKLPEEINRDGKEGLSYKFKKLFLVENPTSRYDNPKKNAPQNRGEYSLKQDFKTIKNMSL